MSFRDNIRNQIYENERNTTNTVSPSDVDDFVDECLHNYVNSSFNRVVTSNSNDGRVINENGKRIFRIELNLEKTNYLEEPADLKNYINRLGLDKNQTYPSSNGLYELQYIHYNYSMLEDEWCIVQSANNHESEMKVQTRQQKLGFFGSNYKNEYRVDRCYALIRFSKWFNDLARQENMRVTYLPYATIKINRTRNNAYYEKEILQGFDEWYEYDPTRHITDVGVMIRIDVDL